MGKSFEGLAFLGKVSSSLVVFLDMIQHNLILGTLYVLLMHSSFPLLQMYWKISLTFDRPAYLFRATISLTPLNHWRTYIPALQPNSSSCPDSHTGSQ
jgi:hypothetical protein